MEAKELYELYKKHPVVTTDSRDCPEGSIFIALKGASFDGNKFAKMALEKGCSYAVIDEKEYAEEGDDRYIVVGDTLPVQHTCHRHNRNQRKDHDKGADLCRTCREIQRYAHRRQLQQ